MSIVIAVGNKDRIVIASDQQQSYIDYKGSLRVKSHHMHKIQKINDKVYIGITGHKEYADAIIQKANITMLSKGENFSSISTDKYMKCLTHASKTLSTIFGNANFMLCGLNSLKN